MTVKVYITVYRKEKNICRVVAAWHQKKWVKKFFLFNIIWTYVTIIEITKLYTNYYWNEWKSVHKVHFHLPLLRTINQIHYLIWYTNQDSFCHSFKLAFNCCRYGNSSTEKMSPFPPGFPKTPGVCQKYWTCLHFMKKKYILCFYQVVHVETRVEVWENEKCCENMSHRRVFPQLFRVLPNFHKCFYTSIETQSTWFLFLLENIEVKKRQTTC